MRAFLETYGVAIFVLVIIGIMVLMASGVGNEIEKVIKNEITRFATTAKTEMDGALTKDETGETEEPEETPELNEYGFSYGVKYSFYDDYGDDYPLGENSFIFNEDGTISYFVNGNFVQDLSYEETDNGLLIHAFGICGLGANNGTEIVVSGTDIPLLKTGSVIVSKDSSRITWENGEWTIHYFEEGCELPPGDSSIERETLANQILSKFDLSDIDGYPITHLTVNNHSWGYDIP